MHSGSEARKRYWKNGEMRFSSSHEPFMICPVCNTQGWVAGGECSTCQGQGYIPEDWQDLDAWIPWGKA